MLDLYKNIKELRTANHITQSELAARTGYSDKSMIAKIEKGSIDLPQSKIEAFAKALGTTPLHLMGWDEPEAAAPSPAAPPQLPKLSDREKYHLDMYRAIDDNAKDRIDNQLEMEYRQSKEAKKKITQIQ